EAGASGAKRRSYGQLPFAHARARQQQACEIGAREEEHKRDGANQHENAGARAAHDDVKQWLYSGAGPRPVFSVLLAQTPRDRRHLRAPALDRDTGPEPRDDVEHAVLPETRDGVVGNRGIGNVDVDAIRWIMEVARHDAEHLVRIAAQREGAPHDGCCAGELAAPEGIRQHDHVVGPAAVHLIFAREPAKRRLDTKRGKETRLNEGRREPSRVAFTSHVDAAATLRVPVAADVGEYLALRPPVIEI